MSEAATSSSAAATSYLTGLLNKTLHVHTQDGRMFVGQMKCTDNERNIILGTTHEYRRPIEKEIKRAAKKAEAEGRGDKKVKVDMKKRFVGLIVVPGKYIDKIEVEG